MYYHHILNLKNVDLELDRQRQSYSHPFNSVPTIPNEDYIVSWNFHHIVRYVCTRREYVPIFGREHAENIEYFIMFD